MIKCLMGEPKILHIHHPHYVLDPLVHLQTRVTVHPKPKNSKVKVKIFTQRQKLARKIFFLPRQSTLEK